MRTPCSRTPAATRPTWATSATARWGTIYQHPRTAGKPVRLPGPDPERRVRADDLLIVLVAEVPGQWIHRPPIPQGEGFYGASPAAGRRKRPTGGPWRARPGYCGRPSRMPPTDLAPRTAATPSSSHGRHRGHRHRPRQRRPAGCSRGLVAVSYGVRQRWAGGRMGCLRAGESGLRARCSTVTRLRALPLDLDQALSWLSPRESPSDLGVVHYTVGRCPEESVLPCLSTTPQTSAGLTLCAAIRVAAQTHSPTKHTRNGTSTVRQPLNRHPPTVPLCRGHVSPWPSMPVPVGHEVTRSRVQAVTHSTLRPSYSPRVRWAGVFPMGCRPPRRHRQGPRRQSLPLWTGRRRVP